MVVTDGAPLVVVVDLHTALLFTGPSHQPHWVEVHRDVCRREGGKEGGEKPLGSSYMQPLFGLLLLSEGLTGARDRSVLRVCTVVDAPAIVRALEDTRF